jgi:transposase
MRRRPRRNHSPAFKAKVALAAAQGNETLSELSQRLDVHPNQIADWKTQLLDRAAKVFGESGPGEAPVDIKALHAKIGEGETVGRKHVATLMGKMGIEALYRKPNTSRKHPAHPVYPYLLRHLSIERP